MSSRHKVETLAMPDADVRFYPGLFDAEESAAHFQALKTDIVWEQKQVELPTTTFSLPRLIAWYGDAGKTYSYSGVTVTPHPWTPLLLQLKSRVEEVSDTAFNSVLLNLYRDENDSVSWHSDDEPELGENPVIASVSFGATRGFQFKHKHNTELRRSIELTPGSVLLMAGTTQAYWKHQIPKSKTPCGERINLTFRVISRP